MSIPEVINVPFKPGMHLTFTGAVRANPVVFSLNVGHSKELIALHFKAQFDEKKIILNSMKDTWAEEQKHSNFPFSAGQEFQVTISYELSQFHITLADGTLLTFPNRLGDVEYKHIFLWGDADATKIKLE